MKCLICETEMEKGTVEGYAQGGAHIYMNLHLMQKKRRRV